MHLLRVHVYAHWAEGSSIVVCLSAAYVKWRCLNPAFCTLTGAMAVCVSSINLTAHTRTDAHTHTDADTARHKDKCTRSQLQQQRRALWDHLAHSEVARGNGLLASDHKVVGHRQCVVSEVAASKGTATEEDADNHALRQSDVRLQCSEWALEIASGEVGVKLRRNRAAELV